MLAGRGLLWEIRQCFLFFYYDLKLIVFSLNVVFIGGGLNDKKNQPISQNFKDPCLIFDDLNNHCDSFLANRQIFAKSNFPAPFQSVFGNKLSDNNYCSNGITKSEINIFRLSLYYAPCQMNGESRRLKSEKLSVRNIQMTCRENLFYEVYNLLRVGAIMLRSRCLI